VLEGDGSVSGIALALANNLPGWSSVVYFDANGNGIIDSNENPVSNLSFVSGGATGLAPGESVRLLVKVIAPAGSPAGAIDTSTLTATTANGSYSTTAPAVATVTDSSTVVAGDIQLFKEQALDANLDGNPDTAYSVADITTGAVPGKAIRYRITVKNAGAAPATSVTVYDTTPAYTTYTSQNPAAVTGVAGATITTPANGAAGALQFIIGTLNPGEQAIVTFGVRIDQ
jgi:uncharacterized repeat protein (TIGR01451 family)